MAISPNTPARGVALPATAAPVDGVVLAADSAAVLEGAVEAGRGADDFADEVEARMLLAAGTLAVAVSSLAVAVGGAIATHRLRQHSSPSPPFPQKKKRRRGRKKRFTHHPPHPSR